MIWIYVLTTERQREFSERIRGGSVTTDTDWGDVTINQGKPAATGNWKGKNQVFL